MPVFGAVELDLNPFRVEVKPPHLLGLPHEPPHRMLIGTPVALMLRQVQREPRVGGVGDRHRGSRKQHGKEPMTTYDHVYDPT